MKSKRRQGRVDDWDIKPDFDGFDYGPSDYSRARYDERGKIRPPPSPPLPPPCSSEKEQTIDRRTSLGIINFSIMI